MVMAVVMAVMMVVMMMNTHLGLRTSASTDSSTSPTQSVVNYDEVDDGGGCNGDADRKCHSTSIEVSSKASVRCATHLDVHDELINGLIN